MEEEVVWEMTKTTICFDDDVEAFIRKNLLHKKGDLSKAVNDAFRKLYNL